MPRYDRISLLQNSNVRRFALEASAILLTIIILFNYVLAPWLRSTAPGIFSGGLSLSDAGSLPNSVLDLIYLIAIFGSIGLYWRWRIYHTELGEQIQETYF